MIALILGMTVVGQTPAEVVDAAQFLRLVRAELAKVEDLSLMYEGQMRWVGSPGDLGKDPSKFDRRFQGTYWTRDDGAEALDLYLNGTTPDSAVTRTRSAVFDGEMSRAKVVADARIEEVRRAPAGMGAMTGPQSIDGLLFYWLFRGIEDLGPWGYEHRGWEDVDGHRCFKVKLNWTPNSNTWHRIFWIDLERGAQPIKVEDYVENGMGYRLDRVLLRSFDVSDGQKAWLPISGVIEGFDWKGTVHTEPVTRTTMKVLDGSVQLNRGISDATFEVVEGQDLARAPRDNARAIGLSLRQQYVGQEAPAEARVDMEGVEENLEKVVAEAEAQGEAIEASAPSRRRISGTTVGQVALIGLGVGLLVVVLIQMRRRG